MAPKTCHSGYPPFPSDIETAPLTSISLAELEANNVTESTEFFESCKDLGFFYLNLNGSSLGDRLVESAEGVHRLEQEFFRQPFEEKDKFAREKIDPFFGYRSTVIEGVPGQHGGKGAVETYNLRKDDILGLCKPLPCHELATKQNDLLKAFTLQCREVIDLLIVHLESHLELAPGTLAQIHRLYERSGDHVRFTQAPIQPFNPDFARKGEHTDFGSLTVLFNWLGGLQIRRPSDNKWVYVKPVPGAAVVNLGDALVKFTAGLLRSNVHRVVPAPPPQDQLVRNSLVYFARPEDTVVLRRLKGGLIDAQPTEEHNDAEPELTAQEWILRRSVGDLQGVFTHRGGLEKRGIQVAVN